MKLPDTITLGVIVAFIIIMLFLQGCENYRWYKKEWNYERGVMRTEYRSGRVKYEWMSAQDVFCQAKDKELTREAWNVK